MSPIGFHTLAQLDSTCPYVVTFVEHLTPFVLLLPSDWDVAYRLGIPSFPILDFS